MACGLLAGRYDNTVPTTSSVRRTMAPKAIMSGDQPVRVGQEDPDVPINGRAGPASAPGRQRLGLPERAVPDPGRERAPLTRGEDQRGTAAVLRVPHRDQAVPGRVVPGRRDLYATAVSTAVAALAPCQTGQVQTSHPVPSSRPSAQPPG